ncbi:hypothetical protein EBR96_08265, partial [bacterium]|nr:hypothetical protein [bacterium]
VVITGDLLDAPPIKLRAYIPILQQLRPPGGVFVVSGNHDFYSGPFEFQAYIRQAGFQLVDNDIVTVDGIQIAGLPDETAGQFGYPIDTLETLLQRLSPELPAILLRHQPVEIEKAADHGAIILKLSGHTHNGQMVPWNWVVRIRYGKFTYGLNKVKDMFAYTTNGTSTWGPPFRLFKPCEIVAFELS